MLNSVVRKPQFYAGFGVLVGLAASACQAASAQLIDAAGAERVISLVVPERSSDIDRRVERLGQSPTRREPFPTAPLVKTTLHNHNAYGAYVVDREAKVQSVFIRATCRPFDDPDRLLGELARTLDPRSTDDDVRRVIARAKYNWDMDIRLPTEVGLYRLTAYTAGSTVCRNYILEASTTLYFEYGL